MNPSKDSNFGPGYHPETNRWTEFELEGTTQQVTYKETLDVKEGVKCDVYHFVDDIEKDLGIIWIEPGSSTPLQKVLQGTRTVEGYISGKGRLIIQRAGQDEPEVYIMEEEKAFQINVNFGDIMQWQADKDSYLVAYEICFPPYEDGRYEDLTDEPETVASSATQS